MDAVRRQHQRDAYAAFLSGLNAYAYATDWERCLTQARQDLAEAEGGASSAHYHPGAADPGAKQVRSAAGSLLRPLRPTLDVVSLEGPGYVADLADQAYRAALAMGSASSAASVLGPLWVPLPDHDPNETHRRLLECIAAFTAAARDYLNGESQRQR
ncbi:hypothetical protein AB0F96_03910 [Streptomyces sp. NPDC023998]|uniref:hypothetical protein n=1 Tax=Streptomyces sp. NPDC023998 TaxID=3154597 RepID=UPI0033F58E7F